MAPRRSLNRPAIEAAWHQFYLSAEEIALAHRTTAGVVYAVWSVARKLGRLPQSARSQAIAIAEIEASSIDESNADSPIDLDTEREFSGRDFGAPDPEANRAACEESLCALERAHGADPRRRFDCLVFDDRKSEPTPEQLLAFMRKHDARMAEMPA